MRFGDVSQYSSNVWRTVCLANAQKPGADDWDATYRLYVVWSGKAKRGASDGLPGPLCIKAGSHCPNFSRSQTRKDDASDSVRRYLVFKVFFL